MQQKNVALQKLQFSRNTSLFYCKIFYNILEIFPHEIYICCAILLIFAEMAIIEL